MTAAFVYFILPAILLILGLPIFVVLILTSLAAIVTVAHVPLQAIQTYMFGSLDNFPLLAVPFFVLAGEIMGRGGIANRVVNWVVSIIGGVRGSLAVTTVASSELFGAMAHTSVGTVVAIGRLLFPSLTKHGYSERFAVSLITSSGAVAVIIPPSISMILYAMTAQVSAIKLFTAGILPSVLIGIVDAVGAGVTTLKEGDRVCALLVHGGYATHVVRGAEHWVKVPGGLDDVQAVALILNYVTA